jgi:hypothetical protein
MCPDFSAYIGMLVHAIFQVMATCGSSLPKGRFIAIDREENAG